MDSRNASPELLRWLASTIMQHEGGYDAVNRNTDGAGASVGIYQWPQRGGSLYQLLSAYYEADPRLFARIFGSGWKELLALTKAGSMEPLEGAPLWQEPWVGRFQRAGREPVFQEVQNRLAREGVFMKAAFDAARILGVLTPRALVLTLDVAAQQGPQKATGYAAKARSLVGDGSADVRALLAAYVEAGVAGFRTKQAPDTPHRSSSLRWRHVGDEWHLFAGQIDLYTNMVHRRTSLLRDPRIPDDPLTQSTATV